MSHASLPKEDPESAVELADNELYDFISNKPVKDSPTERILQAVARSLVDEYGFDHTQLQRDQTLVYEVVNEQGKARKVRRKLSVVVYPEGVSKDDPAQIIRVCLVQSPATKADDGKRGVILLEEVMGALPACDYGLWTNGTDLVFKQKLTGGGRIQPEYVDLYDLPGYGETAADLDRPDRQVGRIATGDNLQRTFARVHDYIYGNQGLKKDAAFWQVLNLIFCKIHDERTPGSRRFWVKGTERNTPEGQAAIAARIKDLFDEVKHDPSYSSIFSERDAIELNDRVLAYVVGELSRYNLVETDVDAKGAAYEEITSSMLKAQRGQFFTPTNVIRLMVQMMDPGGEANLTDRANWPRIIDPACGSGRFLTYALDHIRRKMADQLFPDEHPLLRVRRLEKHPEFNRLVRETEKTGRAVLPVAKGEKARDILFSRIPLAAGERTAGTLYTMRDITAQESSQRAQAELLDTGVVPAQLPRQRAGQLGHPLRVASRIAIVRLDPVHQRRHRAGQ